MVFHMVDRASSGDCIIFKIINANSDISVGRKNGITSISFHLRLAANFKTKPFCMWMNALAVDRKCDNM